MRHTESLVEQRQFGTRASRIGRDQDLDVDEDGDAVRIPPLGGDLGADPFAGLLRVAQIRSLDALHHGGPGGEVEDVGANRQVDP